MDGTPIRVGVSACLLGHRVRWDGGHKADQFLVRLLGRHVEWLPVCPEVEVGLPIPRDTLRLVRRGGEVRLVMPRAGSDHTEAMLRYADERARALAGQGLCGFVLKKDSPTCGRERVRVYSDGGMSARDGQGFFAAALQRHLPDVPIEEEGRLSDPSLRESFVVRVFVYHALQRLFAPRWRPASLVAFHAAHKLLVMAHSPAAYRRLGRIVAAAGTAAREDLRRRYQSELMAALAVPARRGRHANVLAHMLGHVSRALSAEHRREMHALIDDYARELVPLLAPLTLLRHHATRLGVSYLVEQVYLDPYPRDLMLRR